MNKKMKKYEVELKVTLSVHLVTWADSKEEASQKAREEVESSDEQLAAMATNMWIEETSVQKKD